MPTDCPTPPRRLITDCVLRSPSDIHPAWAARRVNKMRERFPVGADHQPLAHMNLIAPVQPTLTITRFDRPF